MSGLAQVSKELQDISAGFIQPYCVGVAWSRLSKRWLADVPFLPMGEVETSYYLRMRVQDKPGVLADITRILADREISIDAMIQKEPSEGEDQTDIILLTHTCIEKQVIDAIAKIEALTTVNGKVVRIRLEELN